MNTPNPQFKRQLEKQIRQQFRAQNQEARPPVFSLYKLLIQPFTLAVASTALLTMIAWPFINSTETVTAEQEIEELYIAFETEELAEIDAYLELILEEAS